MKWKLDKPTPLSRAASFVIITIALLIYYRYIAPAVFGVLP
jgi:hypothetical protein